VIKVTIHIALLIPMDFLFVDGWVAISVGGGGKKGRTNSVTVKVDRGRGGMGLST